MIMNSMSIAAGMLARSTAFAPFSRRFFARRANIIYYHGVWRKPSTSFGNFGGVTVDAFERDMKLLCEFFRPVSLKQMVELNARGQAGDEPMVAVTFDDGCDLTRSGATDVLDRLGIPATTFVVLDCIGNRRLMWHHMFSAVRAMRGDELFLRQFRRLANSIGPATEVASIRKYVAVTRTWPMSRKDEYATELWQACDMPPVDEFLAAERPYVTWDDLDDWRRRGHAVGLHTRTHPFCSQLDGPGIAEEITDAAKALTARLGVHAVPFAYPFGDRLSDLHANRVLAEAPISCLVGIDGPRPLGTAPHRLGRSRGETDLNVSVFSKPIADAVRRSLN